MKKHLLMVKNIQQYEFFKSQNQDSDEEVK